MKKLFLLLPLLLLFGTAFSQTEPRLVLPVGHTGAISDIAISDDQRLIAFASYEGSITVWDYKTQTLLSKLSPFSGANINTRLDFFPNSDSLFCYISQPYGTSTQPKKIIIYDLVRKNEPTNIIDLDSIPFFNYNNDGQIVNYGMLNAEWNQTNQQFVVTPMIGTVFSYSLKTKKSIPICFGIWKEKRKVISKNNIIIWSFSKITSYGAIIEDEHPAIYLYSLNGELLDKEELFEDENSTLLDCNKEPNQFGAISQTIFDLTIPNYVRRTFGSDSIADSVFVFTSEDNKLKKKFHSHFTYPKIQGSNNFNVNHYYMVKDTNLLVSYPTEIWDSNPIQISFFNKDSTFILAESIKNYFWSDRAKTIKKYSAATKIVKNSEYWFQIPKNQNQTTIFFDTYFNGLKQFDLESGNISHSFQKEGKKSTLLKIKENLFANVLREKNKEKKEVEKETFKQSFVLSNEKFSPRGQSESYNIYNNPLICDSHLYFIDTNIIITINKLNIHNNELISKAIDSVNNHRSYIHFGSETSFSIFTDFNLIELNNSYIALCSDSISYIFDKKNLRIIKNYDGCLRLEHENDTCVILEKKDTFHKLNLKDFEKENLITLAECDLDIDRQEGDNESKYYKIHDDGLLIYPYFENQEIRFMSYYIDSNFFGIDLKNIDTSILKLNITILGKNKNWIYYYIKKSLNDSTSMIHIYAYESKSKKTKHITNKTSNYFNDQALSEQENDYFICLINDTIYKFHAGRLKKTSSYMNSYYNVNWLSHRNQLYQIKADSNSIEVFLINKNLSFNSLFKINDNKLLSVGRKGLIYTIPTNTKSFLEITCWELTSSGLKKIQTISTPLKSNEYIDYLPYLLPFDKELGGVLPYNDSTIFIFNKYSNRSFFNCRYIGKTKDKLMLKVENFSNNNEFQILDFYTLSLKETFKKNIEFSFNSKVINDEILIDGKKLYSFPDLNKMRELQGNIEEDLSFLTSFKRNDRLFYVFHDYLSRFYTFCNGQLINSTQFKGRFVSKFYHNNITHVILERTDGNNNNKSSIYLVDIENLKLKGTFSSEIPDDWDRENRNSFRKVVLYDEKKELLFVFQSNGKIIQLDPTNLSFIKSFEGHKTHINNLFFVNDSIFMTQSNDLEKKYWNLKTGKCILNLLVIDENNHLYYDEHYRFDGTPGAIEKLYFVCGLEVVELNQIKDSLYVPHLVQRIMNGENLDHLPKLSELNICGVTPVVEPLENDKSGNQGYRIIPRSGGVGDVDVYINGVVRLSTNAKKLKRKDGNYMLYVEKELLELYQIPGEELKVKVIAKTANNSISSRGVVIDIESDEKTTFKKPALHAIMIGVDDYKGDGLDLNYAAKDANDLQIVLQKSAQKFFNIDDTSRVHFYNLTVNRLGANGNEKIKGITPDRTNIINTIAEIEKTSKPEDILLLFFAGHGEIVDKDQLLLLTSESSREDFKGLRMRKLLELLNKVPAGKRVLILDACHSGAAINNLDMAQLTGKRDVKDAERQSQRLKELDKLASKSGFAIITASSSDQKALELPQYEHGLMTYALLNAMLNNKSSLDENNQLQLDKWLMATEEEVKKLNQNQSAERMVPVTFTLGKIDEEVRSSIVLREIPTVFVSNVLNVDLGFDDQKIKDQLKKYFSEKSRGSNKTVYLSEIEQTNSVQLNVMYVIAKNQITFKVTLLKNNEVLKRMEKTGYLSNQTILLNELMSLIENELE
jgi:hypothetical protein